MVYRIGDQYLPEGVAALDIFFVTTVPATRRTMTSGSSTCCMICWQNWDILDSEIDIVCGYRTPWSNNYLREHSNGVALHSQHMEAKAIDIRIPGIPTALVRNAALVFREAA